MEESYKKDKEDDKYSEETKTIIKHLMMLHFQKNAIRYTLTHIYIWGEGGVIGPKKEDVKNNISEK